MCILGFIIGFPLPIIVALMLNSTKNKKLSKLLQTLFNGPHFISLVVLVGMLYLFFGRYGLVNNIIESVGGERYSFFLESGAFRPMYILSSNWQDFGWSSIVYLAALSGVDTAQHEAATIDGASASSACCTSTSPPSHPSSRSCSSCPSAGSWASGTRRCS